MKFRELFAAIFILTSAVTLVSAAEPFQGIEKLMDPAQFKQAGLHKLTAEELETLNQWLSGYADAADDSAAGGQTAVAAVPERIVSHIDGPFSGWDGKTVFRLKNGQVWRQRIRGKLSYRAANPKVEINRNFLGFYMLRLVDTPYEVGVTRIK